MRARPTCSGLWRLRTQAAEPSAAAGETLAGFFTRADVAQVKSALADLERIDPADTVPLDFVDLGEEHEFTPEVQDGECSA